MGKTPMHKEPCHAEARGDAVYVQGPDDIEVALTPKAALETARELERAAVDSIMRQAAASDVEGR